MPDYQDLLYKHDTNGDSLISKKEFPKDFHFNRRPEMQETSEFIANLIDYWELVDTDKSTFIDSSGR